MTLSLLLLSFFSFISNEADPCGYNIEIQTSYLEESRIVLRSEEPLFDVSLTLFDLDGNRRLSKKQFNGESQLEFSNLKPSNYLIQVKGNNCTQTIGGIQGIKVK